MGGQRYLAYSTSSSVTTSGSGANSQVGSVPGSGLASGNTSQFSCPTVGVNNIAPANFQSYGVGNFRVCSSTQNQADVEIYGFENMNANTATYDQVCVFPAQTAQTGTDQEITFWKPNVNQSGAPWYICQAPSANGTVFSFTGIGWNSAYIVDGKDATLMQTCLIYGPGSSLCPSLPEYSFGIFR